MDISMSDKCLSKGKFRTVLYYDTKDNIANCTQYGSILCRWLYAINKTIVYMECCYDVS